MNTLFRESARSEPDSSDEFYYVEALKSKYRSILPDTRGHGASDKPRDPQPYTPVNLDITSVLDGVGVSKAVSWGYSQGGWIGFALAQHALVRIVGFGAPLRRAPPPPTD